VFSKGIKRHVYLQRSIWCCRRFVFDPELTISSTSCVQSYAQARKYKVI